MDRTNVNTPCGEVLSRSSQTTATIRKARKPRNRSRINVRKRVNIRKSKVRKPNNLKRPKDKSHQIAEQKVSIQKLKVYFRQLSQQNQKKFMDEMANEVICGALLAQGVEKGLKIHNINHCIVQIDPIQLFSQEESSSKS